MDEIQSNMSILTKQVVQHLITGYTLEEAADRTGIKVPEAVIAWKDYVAQRHRMPKEEQFVLQLLRVEDLLTKANNALAHSQFIEDYKVVLEILDRIEALQSLNLSRKAVAEAEQDKLHRLQGEQVISILESSRLMMKGMIEEAFEQKTLKAAKASLLEDLGEYTDKALDVLELETAND